MSENQPKKEQAVTGPVKPRLRIVDAEELDTGRNPQGAHKSRSALVQHFLKIADNIDAEIEKIMQL